MCALNNNKSPSKQGNVQGNNINYETAYRPSYAVLDKQAEAISNGAVHSVSTRRRNRGALLEAKR